MNYANKVRTQRKDFTCMVRVASAGAWRCGGGSYERWPNRGPMKHCRAALQFSVMLRKPIFLQPAVGFVGQRVLNRPLIKKCANYLIELARYRLLSKACGNFGRRTASPFRRPVAQPSPCSPRLRSQRRLFRSRGARRLRPSYEFHQRKSSQSNRVLHAAHFL
jgi:hypothetical protein